MNISYDSFNTDIDIKSKKQSNYQIFLFIGFIVLIFVTYVYNTSKNSLNYHNTASNSPSTLTYIVSTSYGVHDNERFPYPWLTDALLIENYKENTFTLVNPTSNCIYNYDINGITDSSFNLADTSSDGSFKFQPTTTGEYQLNVNELCNSQKTKSLSKTLYSKYVRREITALSDEDREDFLDAFATLWTVKTPEGKELYGDSYKSLYHFAIVHNDAGGNPICDEFHTGSGFINNHMYLGSYLEQVMRLVNPKVSLHYMEYGAYFSSDNYAKHQANQLDGGSWSEIFTEKYFGSNDPVTGRIINGRWADLTLPYLTNEFLESEDISTTSTFFSDEEIEWLKVADAHIKNPYGLLRGPWNYSPANYTLRFMNVNLFNDYDNVYLTI